MRTGACVNNSLKGMSTVRYRLHEHTIILIVCSCNIYFQEAHNTQFDFQLLIKNYDNFMLSCIVMFDVPTC